MTKLFAQFAALYALVHKHTRNEIHQKWFKNTDF